MFGFFKTPWTCRREMLFPLRPRILLVQITIKVKQGQEQRISFLYDIYFASSLLRVVPTKDRTNDVYLNSRRRCYIVGSHPSETTSVIGTSVDKRKGSP